MRKQLLVFASIILTATSVSGCGLVPWLFYRPNSDIVTHDPDFIYDDEQTEEKPIEFRSTPGEAGGFDCTESHCAVNFDVIDLKFADSCEDLGIPSDSEEYSSTHNGNQLLIVEASLELDQDLSFEAVNMYTLPPNDGNIYLLHDTQKASWQWPLPTEKTVGLAPPPNADPVNLPDFQLA